MIEEVARLLMLLCLRQASSPEPAEPVYPEPGGVGGADHRPLPPAHPPHLPPHGAVGPRGGRLQDRARSPGSGFLLVLQTIHRFHNRFLQSRRRPLLGHSPG